MNGARRGSVLVRAPERIGGVRADRCDHQRMSETSRHTKRLLRGGGSGLLTFAAVVLVGCGSSSASHTGAVHRVTEAGKQGPGVPASAVTVIDGWANALRDGQLKRAAAYWAQPSAMVNGLDSSGGLALIRIRTTRDALGADATLPCGATLKATSVSGKYVKATFVLGARTGIDSKGECSGVAAVDFLIAKGHIERWLRAPTSSAPAPEAPGSHHEAPGATSI
jgi:hypothetical protein